MKYTFEEKLRIVTLLKSGYPLKRLCKERRLDHHVVGIWRARYELHGEDGLRFGTRAYGYAAEKKEERENKRGRLPEDPMARPKKRAPQTELERLQAENLRLRAENALLKKVKALVEEQQARARLNGQKPSTN